MHKVKILENKNVKITISGGYFSFLKHKSVADNAILLNYAISSENISDCPKIQTENGFHLKQNVGIFRSILEQMGKKEQSKSNVFKAISGKLAIFAATASVNILGQLVAVPKVGSSILEAYKSCKNGNQGLAINDILPASSIVEELKSDIQKSIGEIFTNSSNNQNGKKGFLFFIDDLDRIDPPYICLLKLSWKSAGYKNLTSGNA